jgi:hypothetical protein
MKISLGNGTLNIRFNIFTEPNYEKLKKELSDYFSKNDICGNKIKSFEFDSKVFANVIIPKHPPLEECLYAGDYEKDLKEIGEKYGIKNLGFISWCYHE